MSATTLSNRQIARLMGISDAYISYMTRGIRPWRPDLKEHYDILTSNTMPTETYKKWAEIQREKKQELLEPLLRTWYNILGNKEKKLTDVINVMADELDEFFGHPVNAVMLGRFLGDFRNTKVGDLRLRARLNTNAKSWLYTVKDEKIEPVKTVKNSYVNLSYAEKANYHGTGYIYHPKSRINRQGNRVECPPDQYTLEWPDGTRKPTGRLRYRKLQLRGTEDQARSLLNIITQVPHRTVKEAEDAIEPYVEWQSVPKTGSRIRVALGHRIPHAATSNQKKKRARVILDYHRIKLLDTLAKLCRELGNYECEGDGVGVEAAALWS